MKLYLVRHGVTVEYENQKSQKPESPLSKEGIKQAKLLAQRIKRNGLKFDVVFASPFERAKKTAEIICKELNFPFEETELLQERLKPAFIVGLGPGDSLYDKYFEELKKHWNDIDWKYNNEGESIADVLARAQNFEKHLFERHLNQDILVVSHGIFGRCFIANCILGGNSNKDVFMNLFHAIKIENTGFSFLEYDEDDNRWKIHFLNDHSHLM